MNGKHKLLGYTRPSNMEITQRLNKIFTIK